MGGWVGGVDTVCWRWVSPTLLYRRMHTPAMRAWGWHGMHGTARMEGRTVHACVQALHVRMHAPHCRHMSTRMLAHLWTPGTA